VHLIRWSLTVKYGLRLRDRSTWGCVVLSTYLVRLTFLRRSSMMKEHWKGSKWKSKKKSLHDDDSNLGMQFFCKRDRTWKYSQSPTNICTSYPFSRGLVNPSRLNDAWSRWGVQEVITRELPPPFLGGRIEANSGTTWMPSRTLDHWAMGLLGIMIRVNMKYIRTTTIT